MPPTTLNSEEPVIGVLLGPWEGVIVERLDRIRKI